MSNISTKLLNLQLLLMPSIPAPRPRLFDTELPPPPPVNDLLAAAEDAMKKAAAHIDAADRSAAGVEQQRAEKSFEALADIVRQRIYLILILRRVSRILHPNL